MSLATFKKKSMNRFSYLTTRSGKPPGGVFLPQGQFGTNNNKLLEIENKKTYLSNYAPVGFSINGGTRNIGYVGKESTFSKRGTPFRGIHPYGSGTYPINKTGLNYNTMSEPVFNVNEVLVLGDQASYIKPSVLSTYGMLRKKYRYLYNGQYPNYWVQPNYGRSMQSDTKSQGNYLHDLTVANVKKIDVNNDEAYSSYYKNCGATTCHKTPVMFTFNKMASNAPYTKTLKQPIDCSVQTLRVQRRCAHPIGKLKPFPYTANNETSCSILNPVFLTPPKWYTEIKNNSSSCS